MQDIFTSLFGLAICVYCEEPVARYDMHFVVVKMYLICMKGLEDCVC